MLRRAQACPKSAEWAGKKGRARAAGSASQALKTAPGRGLLAFVAVPFMGSICAGKGGGKPRGGVSPSGWIEKMRARKEVQASPKGTWRRSRLRPARGEVLARTAAARSRNRGRKLTGNGESRGGVDGGLWLLADPLLDCRGRFAGVLRGPRRDGGEGPKKGQKKGFRGGVAAVLKGLRPGWSQPGCAPVSFIGEDFI